MNRCPRIDVTKTLGELTGVDWGPVPDDPRVSVHERHVTRRKPLGKWTNRELIRFLCIVGEGEEILVPVAIERIEADLLAASGSRRGELLGAVLEAGGFNWRACPECVRHIRELCGRAISQLREDESHDSLVAELHLFRSLSIFERRLSVVE